MFIDLSGVRRLPVKPCSRGLALLALLAMCSTALFADAAADRVRLNVERIMRETGIDEQLAQIPGLFAESLGGADLSDPQVRRITEILNSHIRTEFFVEEVRASLTAN